MTLKELWAGTSNWLRFHRLAVADAQPDIDDEGLIAQSTETAEGDEPPGQRSNHKVVVRSVQPVDKQETLEKLQQGFNTLIEQLRTINDHLNRQALQNEQLIERMEKLPQWLETFPTVIETHKQLTEKLLEQLKSTAAKQQQFLEAVEKIPAETAKQTDALVNIDHQLAAAADTDVQMTESFNKFHETLERLNQSTLSQTDSILQMSKTFATSDRYLKYIISKQHRRFVWVFITAISVCVTVILILAGIIVHLRP